eukprot:CAMPEP_0206229790 /NCGR_PEP_ID=MMETSP0047_2-20121206/9887_1 /ASSEMBLY_ACC=CAM_ASM_000192 /TAXON_ID=195065 /ORGANISM="Chroomonas mesostigmatica_cf, Strain CCMP1168" /LENGTH=191 /DNA_ID=CAMNT_0053653117 /DNA_START=104 /DNA_END=679 /DNA_ORIENTATION=+
MEGIGFACQRSRPGGFATVAKRVLSRDNPPAAILLLLAQSSKKQAQRAQKSLMRSTSSGRSTKEEAGSVHSEVADAVDELGEVDKGVAVLLPPVDLPVALHLLVAHGVLLVPHLELVLHPLVDGVSLDASEGAARELPLVCYGDVEEDTRKVPLEFLWGLEAEHDLLRVARGVPLLGWHDLELKEVAWVEL